MSFNQFYQSHITSRKDKPDNKAKVAPSSEPAPEPAKKLGDQASVSE